jgi:hypothetical protein
VVFGISSPLVEFLFFLPEVRKFGMLMREAYTSV